MRGSINIVLIFNEELSIFCKLKMCQNYGKMQVIVIRGKTSFLIFCRTLAEYPNCKNFNLKKSISAISVRWLNQSVFQWVSSKLMRIEVPNRIVVIESKSLSKFDRRLLSDSDSNDESESRISI